MGKRTGKRVLLLCFAMSVSWWHAPCYAIENSECIACHGDEGLQRNVENTYASTYARVNLAVDEERFQHSAHHLSGIACVDCHSDIKKLDYNQEVPHPKRLKEVDCTTCHGEQGHTFIHSVHGEVRGKGIIMRCYACHDYHYSTHQEALYVTERNQKCLQCHNPYQSHDWLPQKKAHFDFTQCTACHATKVPHHFHLTFYDLGGKKFLSGDEVLRALKVEHDGFMPLIDQNRNATIDTAELDNLVLLLRQKGLHTTVHAELVSEMQPQAHQIHSKDAERSCVACHSAASPFFDAVTIALSREDGSVSHHMVDRRALESFHVSHFYAIGGTRVRLLDKVGLALLVGGVLVVMGHLGVRLATIPVRRARKEMEEKQHRADH
ncbi:MAG: cytochrome c3 family protein [Thermodesulfobacteriota bacterium]